MLVRVSQRRAGGSKAAERIRIPILQSLQAKHSLCTLCFIFFHVARWVGQNSSTLLCRMNIYMCYDMLCVLCA